LCETWIEEREWGSLKSRLSKNFVWKYQYAVRVKRKSRARGRIITEVRKEIEEINVKEVKAIDGIQKRRLWKIITIYNNSNMKSEREIEDMLEDLEKEMLCIGGDFNARIEKERKSIERTEEAWRNFKDEEVNNEKELLGLVEDGRGYNKQEHERG